MGFMMHVFQLQLFRSFTYPINPGMQNNLRHSLLARRNFFHHTLRMVVIGSDREAC